MFDTLKLATYTLQYGVLQKGEIPIARCHNIAHHYSLANSLITLPCPRGG